MKQKWPLFLGILLLVIGIILRKTTDFYGIALSTILVGVLLKFIYIINKTRDGSYKLGIEILALFLGLSLFLYALYLKRTDSNFNYLFFMIPGISLKVLFIILFIRKTKKNSSTQ